MNANARRARAVLRDRSRGTIPAYRLRLPNGVTILVRKRPAPRGSSFRYYADYRARYAQMSGPWPPDQMTIDECCHWS